MAVSETTTPCIRCGKPRIFSKRWREKIEGKGQVVTHEEYVCQDSECQKIVDAKFAEMRERRLGVENRRANIKIKQAS